jgi:23S rRNA (cytidine1920-2'-O)/16S rRNA (cytidine1409-2'-O)-methyltransferase
MADIMAKKRLDQLLVDKGFFKSRERAKASIMAGIVYVDNQKADKPGSSYHEDSIFEVREKLNPYVSRGGLKLEKAINNFGISLEGVNALDIGSSTGGFTDCMLKNGANSVCAIDVGYGQLAWELRNNPKVKSMERTNIRYVTISDIPQAAEFASIDVSFISLKLVLPVVSTLLTSNGQVVALIKPQFEAGREKVGKHGVVREPETHIEVLENAYKYAKSSGFFIRALDFSPIKGPEGNIEYLMHLKKETINNSEPEIKLVVEQAFKTLRNE